MKKTYSSPVTKAHQINTQNALLAESFAQTLSIGFDEIQENTKDNNEANSKESLWDEIW